MTSHLNGLVAAAITTDRLRHARDARTTRAYRHQRRNALRDEAPAPTGACGSAVPAIPVRG